MSSRTFKGLTALAVSTSFLAISAPAFAQLDEIIVTAQKKEENLQDVPIAIAAFDLQALETNRIEGLEDIGRIAPGVTITPNSADANGVQVNIRGIGILDPQVGQDARVAIYQDGVYLGKTQGLAFDMPDLARIEVLKGPQGTLYGRNSVGGAINLISAKPNADEFSGKIKAEYGNFNHIKGSAAVNIPLGEVAGLRLAGSYLSRDGWVENNGPGVDFGGEEKFGVRGAFGIEFSDQFRLDLAADYNKTEKEPLFYQSFGTGAQPFAAAITSFDDGRQEEVTTSFENEDGDLDTRGASIVGTWTPKDDHEIKATLAYREADSSRFVTLIPTADPAILNQITGGFNQALAPLPFAFSATGQSLRPDFASAFTGNPPEAGLFLSPPGGSRNLVHDQVSLDITYTGSVADGRVDYTLGAFYYDEKTGTGPVVRNQNAANDYLFVLAGFSPLLTAGIDQGLAASGAPFTINGFVDTIDLAPQFPGIQALPPASRGPIPLAGVLFGQTFNPNPAVSGTANAILGILNPTIAAGLGGARQSASNTLEIDTIALALYGQATWHATDDFRITAGLRYSDESKDGLGQSFSPFFIDTTDLLGNPILPNISEFDDDVLNPSLTLEYDFNEDVLLYASYKESFRAGGFNAAAVGPRLQGETFGEDFNFDREDITAYEAGFKGTFLGGAARVNAAGFYSDFSNVQTTVQTDPLIATSRAVVNTDQETYGFEIDGLFAFSESLTARGSYTFIDGEQDDVFNPVLMTISERDELQGTPKNQYLVALNYDGDWNGNSLFGNVSYSHKDDLLRVPENGTRISSQDIVSANIGMGFDVRGNEFSVTLWGQNLTDDEFTIDALPFETFAFPVQVFGQPRSYGVSLGYNF